MPIMPHTHPRHRPAAKPTPAPVAQSPAPQSPEPVPAADLQDTEDAREPAASTGATGTAGTAGTANTTTTRRSRGVTSKSPSLRQRWNSALARGLRLR